MWGLGRAFCPLRRPARAVPPYLHPSCGGEGACQPSPMHLSFPVLPRPHPIPAPGGCGVPGPRRASASASTSPSVCRLGRGATRSPLSLVIQPSLHPRPHPRRHGARRTGRGALCPPRSLAPRPGRGWVSFSSLPSHLLSSNHPHRQGTTASGTPWPSSTESVRVDPSSPPDQPRCTARGRGWVCTCRAERRSKAARDDAAGPVEPRARPLEPETEI